VIHLALISHMLYRTFAIQIPSSFLCLLLEMAPISHASLLTYNRNKSRNFLSSKASFESDSKSRHLN